MLVRRDAGIETPPTSRASGRGAGISARPRRWWTRARSSTNGACAHQTWSVDGAAALAQPWRGDRLQAAPGVTVHQIPVEQNIGTMMVAGEVDAVVHYIVNDNLVDRSTSICGIIRRRAGCSPIRRRGVRYHQKTGLYPINHGMVVKRALRPRSIPG